jgi:hypothetical protein
LARVVWPKTCILVTPQEQPQKQADKKHDDRTHEQNQAIKWARWYNDKDHCCDCGDDLDGRSNYALCHEVPIILEQVSKIGFGQGTASAVPPRPAKNAGFSP